MMKKWLLIVLLGISNAGCMALGLPKAMITYQVIDEAGVPVEDAEVDAGFIEASSVSVGGRTDTNGLCTVQGPCSGGAGSSITKGGYYRSGGGYGWKFKDINKLRNRFEPWNPTVTVVMKKIRNPVAMIHRDGRKSFKFPVFDQPVGFDFEKGDFTAPYGKGVHSDFIVTASKITNVLQGVTVRFAFPNERDGILPFPFDKNDTSSFKWPYEAPLDGYTNSLSKYWKLYEEVVDYSKAYPTNPHTEIHKKHETNIQDDKEINYIFRVRSQVDENGNLIRACYGKIEGDILVGGGFRFRYWFNPDWTRNLEDDPQRNVKLGL